MNTYILDHIKHNSIVNYTKVLKQVTEVTVETCCMGDYPR